MTTIGSRRAVRLRLVSMLREDVGAIGITMAIAAPVLLGAVGLGVEVGLWYQSKREIQTAADAAAVAGAIERLRGQIASVESVAYDGAARNGFAPGGEVEIDVFSPPQSGVRAGASTAVEVQIRRNHGRLFTALFGEGAVLVGARAVASVEFNGKACVLALDPEAAAAVRAQGNPTITMSGCIIAANSADDAAIVIGGNSTLSADSLWVVGDYSFGGSASLDVVNPPITHAWPIDDPYAGLEVPEFAGCSANDTQIGPNQTVTLSPGVYCGGMKLQGDVTLQPGTYIMDRGDFEATAQSRVRCACNSPEDGVTIILTSSGSASQIGTVDIRGGADIVLRAPSGEGDPMRGIAFYQDRLAPTGPVSKFNGGSSMLLTGTFYFPRQLVEWTGTNDTESPGCVQIVARMVTFLGNSAIDNEACNEGGVDTIPVIDVRLVE